MQTILDTIYVLLCLGAFGTGLSLVQIRKETYPPLWTVGVMLISIVMLMSATNVDSYSCVESYMLRIGIICTFGHQLWYSLHHRDCHPA